jgi:hypothetical protein
MRPTEQVAHSPRAPIRGWSRGALAGLLGEAGLKDAVVDVDRVTLHYRSLERLVSDLRDHGATNVLLSRPRHGLGRASLNAARAAFDAAAEAGIAEERIDILHYAGWATPGTERP